MVLRQDSHLAGHRPLPTTFSSVVTIVQTPEILTPLAIFGAPWCPGTHGDFPRGKGGVIEVRHNAQPGMTEVRKTDSEAILLTKFRHSNRKSKSTQNQLKINGAETHILKLMQIKMLHNLSRTENID